MLRKYYSKSMDTPNIIFLKCNGLYYVGAAGRYRYSESEHPVDTDNNEEKEVEDHCIPTITHSMVFICIGATKEMRYQELLALANRQMRNSEVVPVQLQKEPGNPVDSNAIAFICQANKDWERIGYVVS